MDSSGPFGGAYLFEVTVDGTVVGEIPKFCLNEKICRQMTHWDDYGFKYVPPECKEYLETAASLDV